MKQTCLLILCLSILTITALAQPGSDNLPGKEPPPNPKRIRDRDDLPPEWKEKIAITEAEKAEYKDILKKSKGGLGKLWSNPCKPKKVVDVQDTDCFQWIQYTTASTYRFGKDIGSAFVGLTKGDFEIEGFGPIYPILVDLGEVDFSQINKDTREVKILNDFPLNFDTVKRKMVPVVPIAEFQSLKLSQSEPAKLNHTYILRTAWYNEAFQYTEQSKITRKQIDETVYAFQVVKQEGDITTILWKGVDARRVLLKQSVGQPPSSDKMEPSIRTPPYPN